MFSPRSRPGVPRDVAGWQLVELKRDSLLLASAFWDEPPSSNTYEAQKTQSLHQILYQLRALQNSKDVRSPRCDSLLCTDRPLLRGRRLRGRDQGLLDPPGVYTKAAARLAAEVDDGTPSRAFAARLPMAGGGPVTRRSRPGPWDHAPWPATLERP